MLLSNKRVESFAYTGPTNELAVTDPLNSPFPLTSSASKAETGNLLIPKYPLELKLNTF